MNQQKNNLQPKVETVPVVKGKKRVDTTLVLLALVILGGVVEIVLVGQKVAETSNEIERINYEIEVEHARRSRYEELLDSYVSIEEEGIIDNLDRTLPSADNFLPVIKEIERLSKLSGNTVVMSLGNARLTVDGFEIDKDLANQSSSGFQKPANANYDFLEIRVSLRGEYGELEQFLNLFEQSKFYMSIVSMNINRSIDRNTTSIDTFMNIVIFVQKINYI